MYEDIARESKIVAAYLAKTKRAAERHAQARGLLPSGIVHDSRRTWPYGIYVDRASGSHKWDIDGNEYVDYYGGHGSLLLGHQHPQVVAAAQAQLQKGWHFAAAHELEIEWARLVQQMVPSAERVRFTGSGNEATQLAIRLARAATGRRKIVRFAKHYHGWHDSVSFGVKDNLDGKVGVGIPSDVADGVVLIRPNDVAALEKLLATDRDIAGVLIEPIGASSGAVPTLPGVLQAFRDLTRKHGALLIFDEVVTGFRVSPGGAQGLLGVIPDLTTMAKVIAGGMPGGAVGGRKDILDWIDFDAAKAAGRDRINHQGTHNAHPVCAAAGIATLKLVRDTDVCVRTSALTATLRVGLNKVLEEEGVPWAIYGEYSFFNLFSNPDNHPIRPTTFDAFAVPTEWFKSDKRERLLGKLVLGLLVNGVDPKGWRGGFLSTAHTQADVAFTLEAWRRTVRALQEEGELARATESATAK